MTNVGFTLDWLTVTFPTPTGNIDPTIFGITKGRVKEVRSVPPYNTAYKVGDIAVQWHSEHPEFRIMVRLDGKTLQKLREAGETTPTLMDWIKRHKGQVTRIDLAIDLFDADARPDDMFQAWQTQQVLTPSKTVTMFSKKQASKDAGATLYIGSRQSDRLVRIYDKGKEQKTSLDWTRIEIELKGRRAEQARYMVENQKFEIAVLSLIRDAVEWSDVQWFEDIWSDEYELVDVDKIGRPATNHERWLFEVVIPAVAEAAKNGTPGVVEALNAILNEVEEKGVHGPLIP